MAFSPDGQSFLTGAYDHGARLFRNVPELPDDLERVATWVEVLTGLTLDAAKGTIQSLDNAAWGERGRVWSNSAGRRKRTADRGSIPSRSASTRWPAVAS